MEIRYSKATIKGHGLSIGDQCHFYGMGADTPSMSPTLVTVTKVGTFYVLTDAEGNGWNVHPNKSVWIDTHGVTTDCTVLDDGATVYTAMCQHGWETGFHTSEQDAIDVAVGHGEVSRDLYVSPWRAAQDHAEIHWRIALSDDPKIADGRGEAYLASRESVLNACLIAFPDVDSETMMGLLAEYPWETVSQIVKNHRANNEAMALVLRAEQAFSTAYDNALDCGATNAQAEYVGLVAESKVLGTVCYLTGDGLGIRTAFKMNHRTICTCEDGYARTFLAEDAEEVRPFRTNGKIKSTRVTRSRRNG